MKLNARRVLAAAVCVVAIAPLAACGGSTLQDPYPVADGVNADHNGIALRNVLVVANSELLTLDSLIGSVVNQTGTPDTLESVAIVQEGAARTGALGKTGTTIDAFSAVHFGSSTTKALLLKPLVASNQTVANSQPLEPGADARIQFRFAKAGNVEFTVPVVASGGYYENVPAGVAGGTGGAAKFPFTS